MNQIEKKEPTAWATIFAFEDVVGTLLNGETLPVRVRQVRARQAFHILGIIDDEFALLEYVCAAPDGEKGSKPLPEGWTDLLTPDFHGELVEKARSLNFPVALGSLKRTEAILTGLGELNPLLLKANALRTS